MKVYMAQKNNCSLFKRLFKTQKNGVFVFRILYHANLEIDDVIKVWN